MRRTTGRTCSLDECERVHFAKGYCYKHYSRLRRTGSLETVRSPRPGWTKTEMHRFSRYGVNPEEFRSSIYSQDGKCEICKSDFDNSTKNICQDHCHESGYPRGILCQACNMALGHLERVGFPGAWFDDYILGWRQAISEESEDAA